MSGDLGTRIETLRDALREIGRQCQAKEPLTAIEATVIHALLVLDNDTRALDERADDEAAR